jgi:hypothetical protein
MFDFDIKLNLDLISPRQFRPHQLELNLSLVLFIIIIAFRGHRRQRHPSLLPHFLDPAFQRFNFRLQFLNLFLLLLHLQLPLF